MPISAEIRYNDPPVTVPQYSCNPLAKANKLTNTLVDFFPTDTD